MTLPPSAMLAVTALISAMCAAMLYVAWRRDRAADALLWWSASLGTGALGFLLFLIGGDVPDAAPRMLANYLTLIAAGAAFCAARRQNGDTPLLLALVLGPTLWLAASAKVGDDFAARVTIISLLHGTIALATGLELARRSAGRPPEQRWMAAIFCLVGALHLVRAATGPNIVATGRMDSGLDGAWVIPVAVVSSLYIVALAMLAIRVVRKGGQSPDRSPAADRGRSRQIS